MLVNKFLKILREKYALIAIFLLIFFISLVFPFGGDDYVNSFIYKTEYRMGNIFDVVYSTFIMYITWSGRIIPNFLGNLFLLFGRIPYAIANALVFIMIIKKSFSLLKKDNEEIEYSNTDYLVLFFLNWLLIPVFTQDYIGLTASISYSWTLLFLILYMNHIKKVFEKGTFSIKTIVFCILIGLTNEIVVIFTNVFLLYKIWKQKKVNYCILLISLWIGSIIEVFAPGNFKRLLYFGAEKNTISLTEKYVQFFKTEYVILIFKILIVTLLLYIIKYYLYEKRKKYIPLDLIIISIITLCLQTLIMPKIEPRAYLIPFYFLILSIYYFFKILFIDNKKFYHFSLILSHIIAVCIFFNIIPYYFITVRNLENEKKDLTKYYINKGLKEVAFYENENILNKMDYSHRAYELFFLDPNIFTNVYFSKYYGFKKVYGIPRKTKLFILEFENNSKLDKFIIILDKGQKNPVNNIQIDDFSLITIIPEEVKEIQKTGEGFKIKNLKIIEVKKGITLNIKRDIRKIELDERG